MRFAAPFTVCRTDFWVCVVLLLNVTSHNYLTDRYVMYRLSLYIVGLQLHTSQGCFFENTGFNFLSRNSFVSSLHSQIG